jgi:hypothetical protein
MQQKYQYILREPFTKSFHYLLPLVDNSDATVMTPITAYVDSYIWPQQGIAEGFIIAQYKIKTKGILKFDSFTWPQLTDYKVIGEHVYCLLTLKEWPQEYAHFINGDYSLFSDDAKAIINSYFGGKAHKPLQPESNNDKRVLCLLSPHLFIDEVNQELQDYIGATLDECKEAVGKVDLEKESLMEVGEF